MKKSIASLIFVAFFLICPITFADTIIPKTTPLDQTPLVENGTTLVWNSVNVGLEDHLIIRWTQVESEPHLYILDAFFWKSGWNFMLSGWPASKWGHGQVTLLNKGSLTLNYETGLIFLDEKPVGIWRAHPDHKEGLNLINKGIVFTVPITINEFDDTLVIDVE